MRVGKFVTATVLATLALAGCGREQAGKAPVAAPQAHVGTGQVTVSGDDRIAATLTWQAPAVALAAEDLEAARTRAAQALAAGRLYADAESAIPLYLAILRLAPGDPVAQDGLQRARTALLAAGDAALAAADDDSAALRQAHTVAAVARSIAPREPAVQAYLRQVDTADRLWELNAQAERDLRAGRLGESGDGALPRLREVLRVSPEQPRALQSLAAVESGLIRRAEDAGMRGDFDNAWHWLVLAARVRPGSDTIPDARERIAGMRRARIARLRDEGLVALQQRDGEREIALARGKLAEILRIAEPGNAAAAELRARIELVTHYGLFHPGQAFTDALGSGARGPEMVVVPHGALRMGAAATDEEASDSERPAHYVRFDRGFAMSRTEVTVGDFRRFVAASGHRPTATRRGYSMVYEERNGNFVRHSGIDWRSAYDGAAAGDDLPVLHVSARDADAYAQWLSERSGQRYRLPSEAEFEYALRAGGDGRYPWGDGPPPQGAGNLTGADDRSPGGRRWRNAFAGYDDGYWGPAPVARFAANAYGLHDLAGNVSEWVADCWHDGYRRAPEDGAAWVNPGCRTRVLRGGAWASAPEQTRSAWRAPAGVETTNARVGFRVVREL
ncbi:formylglycine-generating enzyme family protein [Cognatiluteimonas weifangensis]|uniref:formylglycine-generating enzyme family protein n=1 Tax=Cognatiluteimonas weifangensis TaxID=2303539 RepID=UPI001F30F229|nr:formylglycine-generating enzyme family protein [Luteimonas weifangensis]